MATVFRVVSSPILFASDRTSLSMVPPNMSTKTMNIWVGPKGAGIYTTTKDSDGFYHFGLCARAGRNARGEGEPETYRWRQTTYGKRKTKKAAMERAIQLANGEKNWVRGEAEKPKKNTSTSGKAFCPSCKQVIKMVEMTNLDAERPRILGHCPECETTVSKFGRCAVCPECDTMAEMAKDDYICKDCRK